MTHLLWDGGAFLVIKCGHNFRESKSETLSGNGRKYQTTKRNLQNIYRNSYVDAVYFLF